MTKEVIDLQIWQLIAAYIFVIIVLLIIRVRRIGREKQLIISTLRMTIQLVLVGYLLIYIFNNAHPAWTIIYILAMELFAIRNVYNRQSVPLSPAIKRSIALSIIIGTLVAIIYFLFVVIVVRPWFDPQYVIPIAGMLIGNSMTGIALGVSTLVEGMYSHKETIRQALMLGATARAAAKPIMDSAFDSAIMPTINSMLGMGIVFLPGMMTGQILSGVSPLVAIEYQIAILLGILGAVSLTVILFIQLGYKTFFNKDTQFIIYEGENVHHS
ncbi:MAG: iron export ABC transporter permease subunit FetB [Actinomycetaceae bacterium]|nr:iron export ABC transporter permease subunit FetB [Actinomycetaceae bacterium]